MYNILYGILKETFCELKLTSIAMPLLTNNAAESKKYGVE